MRSTYRKTKTPFNEEVYILFLLFISGKLVAVDTDERAKTVSKALSPTVEARVGYFEERENFIHEPEEQFALLDPKIYLKILFPGLISEMATKDETTQLESQLESYSREGLQGFKNGDAMNEKEERVYSNLTKKTSSIDADVLDAISGYSNDLESDHVSKRALTARKSFTHS